MCDIDDTLMLGAGRGLLDGPMDLTSPLLSLYPLLLLYSSIPPPSSLGVS